MPIAVEGAYWMRGGEDLVPMTSDLLQRIFSESGPDFSAQICSEANINDLDAEAVELLRRLWQRESPNLDIATRSNEQLLADAELIMDGKLTYAALRNLGCHQPP
jgi:ATP-dependent DNA helicase RecG